jgi:hypothetical protein
MYKIRFFLSLCLILVLAIGIFIFRGNETDAFFYQELLKSSAPEQNGSQVSRSQQKREGVTKQIWHQGENPLYIRIHSQESELLFFRQDNKIEAIEQLGNVVCIMQEELLYLNGRPMQNIRYLEAEKASYNFHTRLFLAQGVKFWKYQLEGHNPPETIENAQLLMQASADSVEFSMISKDLDFKAHRMRAMIKQLDLSPSWISDTSSRNAHHHTCELPFQESKTVPFRQCPYDAAEQSRGSEWNFFCRYYGKPG